MKTDQILPFLAVFACATALLWTACEREVDFAGQLPDSRIAITGFVEAGQPVAVRVTRSWNLAGNAGDYTLRDVAVSLYLNGALQPPMQFDAGAQPPQYRSASVARAGDRVRIAVRREGFPEASAETAVPSHASPILSIDTVRFRDGNGSDAMRFLIRIKDPAAGQQDYYRLLVEERSSVDSGQWSSRSVDFDCDQDAALSEGFRSPSGDLLMNEAQNIYGIFSDGIFDGGEHTLNIHFLPQYPGPTGIQWLPDPDTEYGPFVPVAQDTVLQVHYVFKLVTLSSSAYLYLKSRSLYESHGENGALFAEPAIIHTNVTGGLGILGAFRTDTAGVDMPPWKTEEQ
ncbi:MAG: DUF4249 domain-containing protein [Tannerella sp.]|jgi:hypothetical protein|nr:DUF4249 domain-containing protein [Tannerella sp.]